MSKEIFVLEWTREEYIADLSNTFKEQNDLSEMTDKEIMTAWVTHGINAGTEDWDELRTKEEEVG